jgi:hypothetical protein
VKPKTWKVTDQAVWNSFRHASFESANAGDWRSAHERGTVSNEPYGSNIRIQLRELIELPKNFRYRVMHAGSKLRNDEFHRGIPTTKECEKCIACGLPV